VGGRVLGPHRWASGNKQRRVEKLLLVYFVFSFSFFFLKKCPEEEQRSRPPPSSSCHQTFLCCWNFWALCSFDISVVCVFCEQNTHKKLSSRSTSRSTGEKERKEDTEIRREGSEFW